MLLEGSDSSSNSLSIIGAIRLGVGEELPDETGVFRGLITGLLALLGGNGLELLDGLSEMGVHLVHVGLVDVLESRPGGLGESHPG